MYRLDFGETVCTVEIDFMQISNRHPVNKVDASPEKKKKKETRIIASSCGLHKHVRSPKLRTGRDADGDVAADKSARKQRRSRFSHTNRIPHAQKMLLFHRKLFQCHKCGPDHIHMERGADNVAAPFSLPDVTLSVTDPSSRPEQGEASYQILTAIDCEPY